MMSWLAWIIFGAITGWLASVITKTNASQGLLGDIIVGILGAVIGGYLVSIFGGAGVTGFNFYSLIVAVIGSIALIFIFRLFRSA